jgi:hypothetical protein
MRSRSLAVWVGVFIVRWCCGDLKSALSDARPPVESGHEDVAVAVNSDEAKSSLDVDANHSRVAEHAGGGVANFVQIAGEFAHVGVCCGVVVSLTTPSCHIPQNTQNLFCTVWRKSLKINET